MRALMILAALPLMACSIDFDGDDDGPGIAGTGSGNSRTYQAADFSKVALAGADQLDVRIGNAFAVRAEGDPEVLEYLRITKDGDTLKVGRRNRAGFSWGDRHAKVFVTMPRIAGGAVAGSGDITIDRVPGGSFSADAAGSGTITVAAMAAEDVDVDIAGSGRFRAAGTARKFEANLAGSGKVDAPGLKATGADISIAGSGAVTLAVTGDAKVSIMGSGDVDLGPQARCKVSKMGSGNVRCGTQQAEQ